MRLSRAPCCLGGLAGLLALASSCIDRFETVTAYQGQRFLCDGGGGEEFERLLAECRDAGAAACGGLMSFKGQLQGIPVTVESKLLPVDFRYDVLPDGGARLLSKFKMNGKSPYFDFTMEPKSVGGSIDVASGETRQLSLVRGSRNYDAHLRDGFGELEFRITAGRESLDMAALTDGGIEISYQSSTEMRARFQASFLTAPDLVDGCFHVFASTLTNEPTSDP